MLANYGYKDGSGEFFISIDTDKCNGCEACVKACLASVFAVTQDENDPMNDRPVAAVTKEQRKRIRYACEPCKPAGKRPTLPCVVSCEPAAIVHSW